MTHATFSNLSESKLEEGGFGSEDTTIPPPYGSAKVQPMPPIGGDDSSPHRRASWFEGRRISHAASHRRRSSFAQVASNLAPMRSRRPNRTGVAAVLDDAHEALLALKMSGETSVDDRVIAEWRASHYTGDVPWSSHVRMLLQRTEELQRLEKAVNFAVAVVQSTMTTILTYCDLISDVLVMKQLFDRGKSITLLVTLLGVSLGWQAVAAYIFNQGTALALCALLGLKPMIDEYRSTVASPPLPGQLIDNVYVLFMTRMNQLGLDSVPQGFVQTVIYLSMAPSERTTLQLISIISTCCSIGSHASRADACIDANPNFQILEPWLYPIFPSRLTHKYLAAGGQAVAIALYAISKMVAIGILANGVSTAAAVVWLTVECASLFAVRAYLGNWRVYISGLDGTSFSLITHVVQYFCMTSAPMLLFRMPYGLSPRVYLGFIVWTLLLANPAMVVLGFVGGGAAGVTLLTVCAGLVAAAVVALLSGAFAFSLMDPERRHTLYTHNTAKMHLRNFWWYHAKMTAYDGSWTTNQDLIKLSTSLFFSDSYVPHDLVEQWKAVNWEAWTNDPPAFFTDEFKAGHVSLEQMHKVRATKNTQTRSSRKSAVTDDTQKKLLGLPSQTTLLDQWAERLRKEGHSTRRK